MIAVSTDYLSIIRALPPGATTIFRNVPWEEYEALLNEITDEPPIHISYDAGVLQITTVSYDHEEVLAVLRKLVGALEDTLRIPIQSYGSATHKALHQRKGTEPDDCFYIQNATKIIGKKIDLMIDPPPDLALEVDFSSPSLSKFPIYAALGVPELWRHKRGRVKFYQLEVGSYEEISQSMAFPFVTPDVITDPVRLGLERGPMPMLQTFTDWIRTNQPIA